MGNCPGLLYACVLARGPSRGVGPRPPAGPQVQLNWWLPLYEFGPQFLTVPREAEIDRVFVFQFRSPGGPVAPEAVEPPSAPKRDGSGQACGSQSTKVGDCESTRTPACPPAVLESPRVERLKLWPPWRHRRPGPCSDPSPVPPLPIRPNLFRGVPHAGPRAKLRGRVRAS